MNCTKVLKIQIKPTIEQIKLLNETALLYRNACKFDMQRLYYHDVRGENRCRWTVANQRGFSPLVVDIMNSSYCYK